MAAGMATPSALDDPSTAAHAWARYRRLMRRMVLVTLVVVAAAMGTLYWQEGMVSIHFYIAMTLGVGLAMMLTAALMGLVFLSSGTGHDASLDHVGRAKDAGVPRRDPETPFNLPPGQWSRLQARGAENPPPEPRRSDVPE